MKHRCELRSQEYQEDWSKALLIERAPQRCIGCLAVARSNGVAVTETVDTYHEAVAAAKEVMGPDTDTSDLETWTSEVIMLPSDDSANRRFIYEYGFDVAEDIGGQIIYQTTDFKCAIEKT